ncbi:MAG: hypothetical protein SFT81_05250 [Candidatus Caenarcaniphilales bacterium]|nr:hypothetical protein [Candidatus Caenarcaniphilales bacterium]
MSTKNLFLFLNFLISLIFLPSISLLTPIQAATTSSDFDANQINPDARELGLNFKNAPKTVKREVMLTCRKTLNSNSLKELKDCLTSMKKSGGSSDEAKLCFDKIPEPDRENFIACATKQFSQKGY